ncbi:hypothetical protein [Lederbergia lenta]|uniref:hypothetical protein n=1 Tax=Lederbergia lenta TaxID=1467 RepID=UPI00204265F5|nr:hypothetical protein [Lederbergia lenta]MCM3113605.1 hypothetical protein [Lederbergia lenta]
MKLSPPLGLEGTTAKITKKKLKVLIDKKVPHFLTGYYAIFFEPNMNVYYSHDGQIDNLSLEELWIYLKEKKLLNTKVCYQIFN